MYKPTRESLIKTLKKDNLRYNEYYDKQNIFDDLYKRSSEKENFNKLFQLIIDEENIKLAYRTIKRNAGSKTPGTNGHNIDYWGNKPVDKFLNYVKARLTNYKPQKIKR